VKRVEKYLRMGNLATLPRLGVGISHGLASAQPVAAWVGGGWVHGGNPKVVALARHGKVAVGWPHYQHIKCTSQHGTQAAGRSKKRNRLVVYFVSSAFLFRSGRFRRIRQKTLIRKMIKSFMTEFIW